MGDKTDIAWREATLPIERSASELEHCAQGIGELTLYLEFIEPGFERLVLLLAVAAPACRSNVPRSRSSSEGNRVEMVDRVGRLSTVDTLGAAPINESLEALGRYVGDASPRQSMRPPAVSVVCFRRVSIPRLLGGVYSTDASPDHVGLQPGPAPSAPGQAYLPAVPSIAKRWPAIWSRLPAHKAGGGGSVMPAPVGAEGPADLPATTPDAPLLPAEHMLGVLSWRAPDAPSCSFHGSESASHGDAL